MVDNYSMGEGFTLDESLHSQKLIKYDNRVAYGSEAVRRYGWNWVTHKVDGKNIIAAVNTFQWKNSRLEHGQNWAMNILTIGTLIPVSLVFIAIEGNPIHHYGPFSMTMLITLLLISPLFMLYHTFNSLLTGHKFYERKYERMLEKICTRDSFMSFDCDGLSEESCRNIAALLNLYLDYGLEHEYNTIMKDLKR